MGAVRVSCQTIALWMGSPVSRSQIIVVSRWLVMPTASTSPASAGEEASAPLTTSRVRRQISVPSCSTHPAFGVICSCSRWSTKTTSPSRSKRMNRELVVPWSMAPTYLAMSVRLRRAAGLVDDVGALLGDLRIRLGPPGQQHVADEEVVDVGADQPADHRADDRYPHVGVHVAVVAGHGQGLPALDPGHEARPEVA